MDEFKKADFFGVVTPAKKERRKRKEEEEEKEKRKRERERKKKERKRKEKEKKKERKRKEKKRKRKRKEKKERKKKEREKKGRREEEERREREEEERGRGRGGGGGGMCHEWRRAIEQRCIIEHQAVFRSDKCWQHGEVGSENVNWGYRMTNWQNGWTTAPERIVTLLIDICLHTFGGWTGSLCQLCNKLRHTNSGRTQATQRRSRRRERRWHLPVHMQPSGPRRDALTPSGTRCGVGGGGRPST